jgi:hypothetical protein
VMAGEANAHDALAAAVGARIEAEAKATSYDVLDELTIDHSERPTLLGRLKAALVA